MSRIEVFRIADPKEELKKAEAKKTKQNAIATTPKKGRFGLIVLWIIIILGGLFLFYQCYG